MTVDGQELAKGSDAHAASVVGDTVGDPFKDTSGPSLNILLKLVSVTALVIAAWLPAAQIGNTIPVANDALPPASQDVAIPGNPEKTTEVVPVAANGRPSL